MACSRDLHARGGGGADLRRADRRRPARAVRPEGPRGAPPRRGGRAPLGRVRPARRAARPPHDRAQLRRRAHEDGDRPRDAGSPHARGHPRRVAPGRLGSDLRPQAAARGPHRAEHRHASARQERRGGAPAQRGPAGARASPATRPRPPADVHHARPGRRRPARPPPRLHPRRARRRRESVHVVPVAGAVRRGREAAARAARGQGDRAAARRGRRRRRGRRGRRRRPAAFLAAEGAPPPGRL